MAPEDNSFVDRLEVLFPVKIEQADAPTGVPSTDDDDTVEHIDNSHDGIEIDVDIVAVPGLGGDPMGSWTFTKKEEDGTETIFNWLKDEGGLGPKFQNARVILMRNASAWNGRFQVDQDLTSLAEELLVALQSLRKEKDSLGHDASQRALVFIGHSMGGLVIAKAICLANANREEYAPIFECVTGCMFFGSPFGGAVPAEAALMYADIANRNGAYLYTEFLELLREGNLASKALKQDFESQCAKMGVFQIQCVCVWEDVPTRFSSMLEDVNKKAAVRQLAITGNKIWKEVAEKLELDMSDIDDALFVRKSSAVLARCQSFDLKSTHRDLVRFKSPKDDNYVKVMQRLETLIDKASSNATQRLKASQDYRDCFETAKKVTEKLSAVAMSRQREALQKQNVALKEFLHSTAYSKWINIKEKEQDSIIWLRGPEAKGRTAMSLKCVQDVEDLVSKRQGKATSGRADIVMAYFFCSRSDGFRSPLDVLRSLLTQMIRQHETLAYHARRFVMDMTSAGTETSPSKGGRYTLSLDNMLQCFDDMLTGGGDISKVFFVIDSIQELDDAQTFLALLLKSFGSTQNGSKSVKRIRTRWLLTSDKWYAAQSMLEDTAFMIDLESPENRSAFQEKLDEQIDMRVEQLRQELGLNSLFKSILRQRMAHAAPDWDWVNVVYVLLGGLSRYTDSEDFELGVINSLQSATQRDNLEDLVRVEWEKTLALAGDGTKRLRLEELLRVLLVTFDSPSLQEAAVISGCRSLERVKDLVASLSPFVTVEKAATNALERIVFPNETIRGLLAKIMGLSDANSTYSRPAQYVHTHIALHSLQHIKDSWEALKSSTDSIDSSQSQHEGYMLRYPVKYWWRHGTCAGEDTANLVRRDFPQYWEKQSALRNAWILAYGHVTPRFLNPNWPADVLGPLHVASAVGYTQLVASLLEHGHKDELKPRGTTKFTPLHLAAYYGHYETAKLLLEARGKVDKNETGADGRTPLHMAALAGNLEMMELLLKHGANINAAASGRELVVHCAVLSGKISAVELVLSKSPILRVPGGLPHPLSYSVYSSPELFQQILDTQSSDWDQGVFDQALVQASYAGKTEQMTLLLNMDRRFSIDCIQSAFDWASKQLQWAAMKVLLRHRTEGIKCDGAFLAAATHSGNTRILEDIWDYTDHSISQDTVNKAFYNAVEKQYEKAAMWLLRTCRADADVEVTATKYSTPLAAAAAEGTASFVEELINEGPQPNVGKGYPLWQAARLGRLEIVKQLLEFGEQVDRVKPMTAFKTPLLVACLNGHTDVVKELLDAGANPNADGHTGKVYLSPIILATERGRNEMVLALLRAARKSPQQRVNLSVVGGNAHRTPLMFATLMLPAETVRSLIEYGADVNQKDRAGNTALLGAAHRGAVDTVQLLLDQQADALHTNASGLNAMQVATQQSQPRLDHMKVLKALLQHVAPTLARLREASDANNQTALWITKPGNATTMPHDAGTTPTQQASACCIKCRQSLPPYCPSCQPVFSAADIEAYMTQQQQHSRSQNLYPSSQRLVSKAASEDSASESDTGRTRASREESRRSSRPQHRSRRSKPTESIEANSSRSPSISESSSSSSQSEPGERHRVEPAEAESIAPSVDEDSQKSAKAKNSKFKQGFSSAKKIALASGQKAANAAKNIDLEEAAKWGNTAYSAAKKFREARAGAAK